MFIYIHMYIYIYLNGFTGFDLFSNPKVLVVRLLNIFCFGSMQSTWISKKLGLPHQVCRLACCACPLLFHIHRSGLLILRYDGLRIPTAVQLHRRDVGVHFVLLEVFLQIISMCFGPKLWTSHEYKNRTVSIYAKYLDIDYLNVYVYIYIYM